MRDVLFYASERHYVDHLAPIAVGLAASVDGPTVAVAAGSRDAHQRFAAYGLSPTLNRRPNRRTRRPTTDDRPVVVVASYGDLRRAQAVGPVVFVEHGAGQTYEAVNGDLPYYSGGAGRDGVAVFLCPNERVAARNAARYPEARTVVVGSPRVEWLATMPDVGAPPGDRPTVALTTHWDCHVAPEARWAFPHYARSWEALARAADHPAGFGLVGHAHPRAWSDMNAWYAQRGIVRLRHFDDVVSAADVLVADNSSVLFEACAVGLRVVVCDAPWYRRDVDHGLRFWQWADVGPRIADGADLYDAVAEVLHADRWAEARAACAADVFGRVAGSVETAVAEVRRAALAT